MPDKNAQGTAVEDRCANLFAACLSPCDGRQVPARAGAGRGSLLSRKVLAFTLNEEDFAVDIGQAKEVLESPCITKIPYVPDFVKGAINLRGEIISVLDIRPFCGLGPSKRTEPAKVLVTDVTGSVMGVLADQVKGTMEICPDQVQEPLLTLDGRVQCHVKGQIRLEDRIVVWLDLRSILQSEAIARLRGTVG